MHKNVDDEQELFCEWELEAHFSLILLCFIFYITFFGEILCTHTNKCPYLMMITMANIKVVEKLIYES